MEDERKELRGFTVDRIKELCYKVHIKVYGKTKDDVIEQLLETESRTGIPEPEESGEILSITRQLMEMIVHMQRDQQSWLEGQQKRGANAAESVGPKGDDGCSAGC